ncbi:MAG: HAMP domain-containing histidine kinase [Cytophagales bacterium]|nr:HAMP domain-containing histidine kinase [Cytophagales bacterium]MDW8384229.1 HAMP domain-containing sensor histidine kinase [Flammeovirgaceae bacterium]
MYEKEDIFLSEARKLLENPPESLETWKEYFSVLLNHYEMLLKDIRFVMRVSDRLQTRMRIINEKLIERTKELENAKSLIDNQNAELQAAKQELQEKVRQRTEELIALNEELNISYRELDDFIYRASHDIKGPLVSIIGLCHLAEMETKDEHCLQYFKMIAQTAISLRNLLTRLLSVDNLKKMEINPRVWHLSTIFEQLENFVRQKEDERIRYDFIYPPNISIYVDKNVLTILLENLLEYAFNNITIKRYNTSFLEVKAIDNANDLLFFISYNGNTIPPELSKEIFKLFHRTSNHSGHTGLELYSATLAATKLGGKIELVYSTEEETLFNIFLPKIIV